MTTSTQQKYITQLLTTDGKWPIPDTGVGGYNRHLLPTLLDAQWGRAFEDAAMPQRENLARGWIWAFAVKKHLGKLDSYGRVESWCVERCASWIKKIEPYVPAEDHTDDLEEYKATCVGLLHRSDGVESAFLRTLWFGADEEKLSLLMTMPDDRKARRIVSASLTCHNRVFEIVALPGSNQQHEISAAYMAMKCGLARTSTTPAIDKKFDAWHQLGLAIERAMPRYPNEEDALIKSRQFVEMQPPEITVPVFTRIVHEELNGEFGMARNSLGSLFWKPGNKDTDVVTVRMGNIYTALADWFPAYREQWRAAASLGLSVLEAGQLISHTLPNAGEIVELPVDLNIG
jgi:hypothetical protein